jgi:hypothetical protein
LTLDAASSAIKGRTQDEGKTGTRIAAPSSETERPETVNARREK